MKKQLINQTVTAIAAILALASPAMAQTILRLDEVAVGELDPAKALDVGDSVLMFNAYDTLVIANQGKPGVGPHLAKSWTIDGTAFTFTLRDDVTFHSGNKMTASDVVYSFNRMADMGQGLSHLFRGHVKSVEATDDHTVVFKLGQPYAPFLTALTRLPILDSKTVRGNTSPGNFGDNGDYGQAFLSKNDAGSGAYRVTSHNPQEQTEFGKFAGYFLKVPDTAPDQVRMRYSLEGATVRTLMARGEHDISSQWLVPDIMRAMARDRNMQLLAEAGTGAFTIKLNTQLPPLDDVHCRRALAHAVDYKSLLSLVKITDEVAQGRPANGPLPVGTMGFNPDIPHPIQDMKKAQEELKQCRHDPKANKITISWIAEVPLEERFALLMQANFQQLGFATEIVRMPWALYNERVTKVETTPHVGQLFVRPAVPDPDAMLYNTYHSSVRGTYHAAQWLKDAEVDRLLDEGRRTVDQVKREEIYRDVSARLVELQPNIFAFDTQTVYIARKNVSAPPLQDPSQAYSQATVNLMFRNMAVK